MLQLSLIAICLQLHFTVDMLCSFAVHHHNALFAVHAGSKSVCMLQFVCFFCYAATCLHEVQILLETTSWQNRSLQTTLVGLFQYMGGCMVLQVGAGQGTGGRGGLGSRGGRSSTRGRARGNGRGRGQGTARSAGFNPFADLKSNLHSKQV